MDRRPSLVSVIIPAHNSQGEIGRQLEAIGRQTYRGGLEVIVADNNSQDGTESAVLDWENGIESLKLVRATDGRGVSYARNRGVEVAGGDLFVFCDSDDVVDGGWLEAMVDAATSMDLIGGRIKPFIDPRSAVSKAYYPSPENGLRVACDFWPFATGASFGIWRDVLTELGGWDESFKTSEDVELSWRARMRGYSLGFAGDAVIVKRGRADLRSFVRQQFQWGRGNALLFKRYGHLGMRRPRLLRVWKRLLIDLPSVIGSDIERIRWLGRVAYRAGRLAGSSRYRVFFP